MTDIKSLALKYGGYTSLDKVYLDQLLAGRSEEEQLALITPPPSVVNAYFAELYQKKSPQAATDYFAEVSQELNLYNANPSFTEESKPFIRLNLSGKSFGFCYESEGLGRIFSEAEETITADLLFEIAQIFPHQLVFEESGKIYMKAVEDEEVVRLATYIDETDFLIEENPTSEVESDYINYFSNKQITLEEIKERLRVAIQEMDVDTQKELLLQLKKYKK